MPERQTTRRLAPAHDPNHPGNSMEYRTGAPCIEAGCDEPAGTQWSPWWCQRHNAERLDRISGVLRKLVTPAAHPSGDNQP